MGNLVGCIVGSADGMNEGFCVGIISTALVVGAKLGF